ncbi:MAG: hypothetical protein U9O06_14825 [Euryarchaeota archaeon]|nr:hypothetical protein [Euryarchaeota archaeon]
MSNDSSPVGGAHGFDSDALEEWVTETARQKGVSKQKLLDEILSSYWVLEELSGVVTDSSVTEASRQSEGQPPEESGAHHTPTDSGVDEEPSQSATAEFSELKSELQGLRTAIEELSQEQRTEDAADSSRSADEFSALEGQLDDLSSAVVERQSETDETVAVLSDRIEELGERLGAIESRLEEGLSLAELEAAVEQNSADHAELEARLESEFDSIEQVLQHLLDTTDNIEYRLGAVSESRQEALKPIRAHNEMQEALADLKQEAIRHGVSKGACDNCGQTIDLGLLEEPSCPSCERRFTGISKGGWLPFSNATINTTDRPQEFGTDRAPPAQQWEANDDATAGNRGSGRHESYQTDW